MAKVVTIFGSKDISMMERDGGVGCWRLSVKRVESNSYVLVIRNLNRNWAVHDREHGQAYMLGKIRGCIESKENDGRKIIQISDYALLEDENRFKNAWKKLTNGQTNPVAYKVLDEILLELNLDFNTLTWRAFKQK